MEIEFPTKLGDDSMSIQLGNTIHVDTNFSEPGSLEVDDIPPTDSGSFFMDLR